MTGGRQMVDHKTLYVSECAPETYSRIMYKWTEGFIIVIQGVHRVRQYRSLCPFFFHPKQFQCIPVRTKGRGTCYNCRLGYFT